MRGALRKQAAVDDVGREVSARVREFASDEEQRRAEVVRRLGDAKTRGLRRWWNDAESYVDDWTRDHLRRSTRYLDLPTDESRCPAPDAVPTIRSFVAYKMARIKLNIAENRRIQPSDYYDAEHYATSVYCHYFVTNDRAFRETCEIIGRPKPEVLDFEAFAQLVLGN
jgi:hypothetical protein